MNDDEKIIKLMESLDKKSSAFHMLEHMDTLFKKLEEEFKISEEARVIIDGELTLFILKEKSSVLFFQDLTMQLSLSLEKEIVQKINDKIEDFIKENSQSEDPFKSNTQKEPSVSIDSSNSSDILTRLNQTMTAPSTLAPTKRAYTETAPLDTTSAPSSAPSGIKSIDPYREIPDK